MDSDGLLNLAFSLVVIAGLVLWHLYRKLRGEDVCEVEGGPGPLGGRAALTRVVLVRIRDTGRRPRVRLVLRRTGHASGFGFDAAAGRRFAAVLERAADLAMQPGGAERKSIGMHQRLMVGVARQQDGMGWVALWWSRDESTDAATCLGPAVALELAETMRIACMPGVDMMHAQQRYTASGADATKRRPAPMPLQAATDRAADSPVTSPAVRLEPMTREQFARYMETAVEEYAEDRFKCGDCTREEALARSAGGYAKLLPQGLETPGQFLFVVHGAGEAAPVGLAWIAMPGPDGPHSAYLYDFSIVPEQRRKGYGAAALRAVEERARSMGARQLALNVMGWNAPARALYGAAGFGITGIGMNKMLA
jgi:ribosomal protein S18 acetylase RimI-like enzyme